MRPAWARLSVVLAFALAACTAVPKVATEPSPESGHGPGPAPFSTSAALDVLPAGWQPYRFARFKRNTDYRLVSVAGGAALHAVAESAASGLRHDVSVDLHEYPWLTWTWKIPALIPEADNRLAHAEDSPARVIVVFEGGRERLAPAEQLNYDLAWAMLGRELPYATLMYIWENHLPEGAIIAHHHTTRIKMVVAGSGQKDLGDWHEERVNLLEDYRRAFGEEPPRVKAVGVMTDSDNTASRTEAYYGDIRFHRR